MKKVLLRAPILTQSGYGVHGRTLYAALKSRPDLFDIYVEPTSWGQTSWMWEDTEKRQQIDQDIAKCAVYRSQNGQFDIALLVTIPNEWERLAPVTIGVTAGIESSKVAPQWLWQSNNQVDKIIVTSTFSKKTFGDTTYPVQDPKTKVNTVLKLNKEIEVINYPVKEYVKTDLGIKLDYDFNFLVVAQWGPRKNVPNMVRWFVEEFIDQEVGLVLKINKSNNNMVDRMVVRKELLDLLSEYPDRKCKVYLLHGSMDNNEMHSLYEHPQIKCLISLTHGEGYGLPLFEAAYCGVPVLSHEWGGQTDFLVVDSKDKNGKIKKKKYYAKVDFDVKPIQPEAVWDGVLQADSMWAYPKSGSAKMKMREVYKSYDRFLGQAKKLKKALIKSHSAKNINEKFVNAVYGSLELSEDEKEWSDITNKVVSYD